MLVSSYMTGFNLKTNVFREIKLKTTTNFENCTQILPNLVMVVGYDLTRSQYYPYTKMPCDVEDERRMDWTCPGFVPRVVYVSKKSQKQLKIALKHRF